jgi:dienelactone hydrolase
MHVMRFLLALLLAAQDPLTRMQAVMGPLPSIDHGLPLEIRILEEAVLEKYTRRKISYLAENGDRVPAYLLIPRGRKGPMPAMLCLHQTTKIGKAEPAGLGGKENLHYAHELAGRGFVTLAPDYPNFGDYSFDPYSHGYASTTMKGIVNHIRAVDLLSSLPEVDANRMGVIGHSLGGHNALFVTAFDKRLRAAATSCGFTSFARYYNGDLTGWSHKGYMPRIAEVYGKSPTQMPWDFSDVLAAIAPRAVFVNAPLHDRNFDVTGVRETVEVVRSKFPRGRLEVRHPDCGHEFPPGIREECYRFLREALAK